ncbi:MAG: hypothetical protein VKP72_12795 [bacterium]|nr:hypothetical protein [bacterium]
MSTISDSSQGLPARTSAPIIQRTQSEIVSTKTVVPVRDSSPLIQRNPAYASEGSDTPLIKRFQSEIISSPAASRAATGSPIIERNPTYVSDATGTPLIKRFQSDIIGQPSSVQPPEKSLPPRPPADIVQVGGGGQASGLGLIDLPEDLILPPGGLPSSGFDRLQEAVNSARLPDGSPLSAAQKKAVYDFYGLASEGMDDAGADAVADKLAILLRNGKELLGTFVNGHGYRPDASGTLAIEHLATLINSPLHPAFETVGKPEIARQILDRLVAPEDTRQGVGTLDCTLATLEGELAGTRPSDFVRIAVGLVTRGSATLTDGSTMPLASFDPADAGGRSLVDLALQSSMGALVAGTTGWDGQTSIGPRSSEILHEKFLGGDWATIGPEQILAYLLSLSSNPDADAILKGLTDSVDGIPKVSLRMPDGSLHSMVLLDTGNFAKKGIGLWDPLEGKNIGYISPMDFAMRFVRATVPAHWVAAAGEATTANSTEGEGGLTRSGARRSLA